jgi:hypothetical protein
MDEPLAVKRDLRYKTDYKYSPQYLGVDHKGDEIKIIYPTSPRF